MNKRFAQIITDATDPRTGRVDRARLFSALEADPNDPTAVIFDAAAFTYEMVEELKSTLPLAVTEQMKKLLDYFDASQRTHASKMDDAAAITANTSCDLRKWSEEFWAVAISEARKQGDAMRASAITAVANTTKATREVERAIRECSEKLFEGQSELAKSWNRFLDEAKRLTTRCETASIILLLMAFAAGILVGAGLSRLF